jgi:hypothetical protein
MGNMKLYAAGEGCNCLVSLTLAWYSCCNLEILHFIGENGASS